MRGMEAKREVDELSCGKEEISYCFLVSYFIFLQPDHSCKAFKFHNHYPNRSI